MIDVEFIALFAVIVFSTLLIRIGATALRMTGLSSDVARFQAKSAFSGAGFSTSESELVVNHPLRRRIISLLITLGNFGVPAMLASVFLAVESAGGTVAVGKRAVALLCVLTCMAIVARSHIIDRTIERVIEWLLRRWAEIELVDYQSVLEIERGYRIARVTVRNESWLAQGSSLRDLRLAQAGAIVIGIHRSGDYIGTPGADVVVLPGDELMIYGSQETIDELSSRNRGADGDRRQLEAMRMHSQRVAEESARLHQASLRSPGTEAWDSARNSQSSKRAA